MFDAGDYSTVALDVNGILLFPLRRLNHRTLKVWQMQLFFTKTGFQILHPQNQRSARAGLNLKSLLRNNNIWCVFINVNLKSFESMNKQFKRLPGVRLSTSVLIRWDGWLSTNSNIGRPLQLETFSREKQKWKVNQKHKHKQTTKNSHFKYLTNLCTPVIKIILCLTEEALMDKIWQTWYCYSKEITFYCLTPNNNCIYLFNPKVFQAKWAHVFYSFDIRQLWGKWNDNPRINTYFSLTILLNIHIQLYYSHYSSLQYHNVLQKSFLNITVFLIKKVYCTVVYVVWCWEDLLVIWFIWMFHLEKWFTD